MTVVHDSWWHEQFSKSCDYAVMTSPTLEVDYTIKFSANTVPAAQSRNLQLIHLSQEGHKRANSLNLEEIAFGLLFYVAYPWLEIRWFFKVIWSHSDDMTSNCGRVFNGLLSRSWSCICKFVEWCPSKISDTDLLEWSIYVIIKLRATGRSELWTACKQYTCCLNLMTIAYP